LIRIVFVFVRQQASLTDAVLLWPTLKALRFVAATLPLLSHTECQASAETTSGISRRRNGKHQPKQYTH
jgi:hypothetical protein